MRTRRHTGHLTMLIIGVAILGITPATGHLDDPVSYQKRMMTHGC